MYDSTFDASRGDVPAVDRRMLWALRIAALAAIFIAASADAQLPGAPVLQNVWATPGLAAAVDFAGGSDGSVYAGAVGWSPGSGRFQLSAGAGYQTRTGGDSRGVYGARVSMPFGGASSSFGFAGFIGVGGGPAQIKTVGVVDPVSGGIVHVDSATSTTEVPIGAAIGWRKTLGSSHGLSVYATPAYVLYSGGGSKSSGLFRAAVGADFGITNAIGATVGVDFGGNRPRGLGGPSSTLYGIGLTYAFGRR